ncbi:deoxyribonuclease II [Ancylostoma caninum]|uniref:Deoxyribonuclease II n=1 Tax=Ancylostoma caninum TaxID=29170 RepID=A0A368FG15_ANCCA|nr:deoxyribonuclease II [Ancylostoma caninum]
MPMLERKMWRLCLALAAFINYGNAKLGCKNMKGEDVDWFAAIKLPPGIDERKGKSFVYFDSTQDGWKMSPEAIDSNKSAIGATINQIYGMDKKNTFTIAYNDDSPVKAVDSNRGHSKGVAAFDADVGFWMIHSIPNFPPLRKYDYPKSGTRFAQSILCLSLSTNALEDLGQYMRYAQVTPFLSNLPDSFKVVAPSLEDVVNKRSLSSADTVFTTIRGIETLNGKKAKGFSKHKKFGADLWYDFIAPNLKTPMAVETWRSGSGKDVGTKCGKKQNVYDVNTVTVLGKTFLNTNDHSKWGVSMDPDVPAVCIGDVNRQVSDIFPSNMYGNATDMMVLHLSGRSTNVVVALFALRIQNSGRRFTGPSADTRIVELEILHINVFSINRRDYQRLPSICPLLKKLNMANNFSSAKG